jgi:hypothetical protein
LSKIRTADRLSGAVLDRGPDSRRGVLELVALAKTAYFSRLRRFCANFLRLSRFRHHVKRLFFSLSGRSNSLLAVVPAERLHPLDKANPISAKSHSAKYQRLTSDEQHRQSR